MEFPSHSFQKSMSISLGIEYGFIVYTQAHKKANIA